MWRGPLHSNSFSNMGIIPAGVVSLGFYKAYENWRSPIWGRREKWAFWLPYGFQKIFFLIDTDGLRRRVASTTREVPRENQTVNAVYFILGILRTDLWSQGTFWQASFFWSVSKAHSLCFEREVTTAASCFVSDMLLHLGEKYCRAWRIKGKLTLYLIRPKDENHFKFISVTFILQGRVPPHSNEDKV